MCLSCLFIFSLSLPPRMKIKFCRFSIFRAFLLSQQIEFLEGEILKEKELGSSRLRGVVVVELSLSGDGKIYLALLRSTVSRW